jgi:hypothetical protein
MSDKEGILVFLMLVIMNVSFFLGLGVGFALGADAWRRMAIAALKCAWMEDDNV